MISSTFRRMAAGLTAAGLVAGLLAGAGQMATSSPAVAAVQTSRDYVSLVNPWVEADIGRFFFFQSASNPFGFVKLRPDTSTHASWGTGYRKNEDMVQGFSHLHEWRLSGIQVMPTSGDSVSKLEGSSGWQSHVEHDDSEIAQPGYHKLHLDRYAIDAELTVTDRVGLHRYTYDRSGPSEIIVNLGGKLGEAEMENAHVTRVNDRELEGFVVQHGEGYGGMHETKLFFNIRFDRPFDSLHGWADGELVDGGAAVGKVAGDNSGAYVRYDNVDTGDQVQMKVGLSLTSLDGARKNLETELPGWDFDAVKAASQQRWNDMLGRIDVRGGTHQQQVKFYTDLFHVLCGRSLVSDVDGKYIDDTWNHNKVKQIPLGKDGKPTFAMYNYDALWLTQWNVNSVLGLAYPEIYSSFVQSQLQMYKDGGLLPRGPVAGNYSMVMTGSPVTSFITGAYNKGIRDFDVNLAYDAMLDAQSLGGLYDKAWFDYAGWGTGGNHEYLDLGYVPNNLTAQGAGQTLEYANQDWALAQLARQLGKAGLNASQFADVSVTSQLNDTGSSGERAVDGRPLRAPAPHEWMSSGEQNPWIKLSWDRPRRIHKVVLSDRVDSTSNVNSGVLTFSDGSRITVDNIPTTGAEKVVAFPWRRVDWVKFQATGGSGQDVGLNEIEVWDDTDTDSYLLERSRNWRNLFDRETGFIRPRNADGSWRDPFDPLAPNDFVEANSWQATWFTVHDVMGLANVLGGTDAYADKLNHAFEQSVDANFIGEYGHGYVSYGNQPGLEVAHLFNYVGKPWLTQYWVRQVKEKTFGSISTTDGYGHHDEDQGQMGAISALMAMGLFEVTGGGLERPVWDITSPIFDEIIIELNQDYYSGKQFRIVTHDNSAENTYIQRATLDGRTLNNAWFHHDQLVDGGTLELWLGPEPNTQWGVDQLPPSESTRAPAVPYVTPDNTRVDPGGSTTVSLGAQNLTDQPVTVGWQATATSGLQFSPGSGSVEVAPNGSASQDVTVRVPDGTPEGVHRVVFTAQTANGTRLPEAIAYVRVAPAVSATTAPGRLSLLQGTPADFQVRLANNDADKAHAAEVSVQAPDGWTVELASRSVDVPAGATTTTTFRVTPPADASGTASLTLNSSGDWGSSSREIEANVSPKVALVGAIDLSTAEFALSPNRFGAYPSTFPDDVDFTVGVDDPATDWSYIHPGPNDGWAGTRSHTFTVRFDLDAVPDRDLAFTLWLIDTHNAGPPTLQLSLNGGASTTFGLPRGGGEGYHWGDGGSTSGSSIRPTVLDVRLPASQLAAGENTVTITSTGGSWMVYDAFGIRGPS
ncbi:glycoside hydrolase domain-containing protein [Actinopolymorpha sp. B17G11]|uniref:glycoside hydrolase domain-containing protein n=1 Tax=Actinopolymorpha sp. B17G11 TaxID=3160861 RepID=UPI0032E4D028